MMTDGSGVSVSCVTAPMRAPAAEAAELPTLRAAGMGSEGDRVTDRQRSSHSSVVPPQPRT